MLEVEDLEEVADGLRVQVRCSKTDQEGQGAVVPVVRGRIACPVEAVNDWMASAGITTGPVFRRMGRGGRVFSKALTPFSIAQVVKRYVKAAGLDPSEFGGHSLRARDSSRAPWKTAHQFSARWTRLFIAVWKRCADTSGVPRSSKTMRETGCSNLQQTHLGSRQIQGSPILQTDNPTSALRSFIRALGSSSQPSGLRLHHLGACPSS